MMGLPTTFGTLLSQILWGATRKGLAKILRPLKRTLMRRIPLLRNAKLKGGVNLLRKLTSRGGARSILGSAGVTAARNLYKVLFGRGTSLWLKNSSLRKFVANTALGRQIRYSRVGRFVSRRYRPAQALSLIHISEPTRPY